MGSPVGKRLSSCHFWFFTAACHRCLGVFLRLEDQLQNWVNLQVSNTSSCFWLWQSLGSTAFEMLENFGSPGGDQGGTDHLARGAQPIAGDLDLSGRFFGEGDGEPLGECL